MEEKDQREYLEEDRRRPFFEPPFGALGSFRFFCSPPPAARPSLGPRFGLHGTRAAPKPRDAIFT